ncbi:hypothetical protein [Streptococcus agalactiae]|uniref:hypothetical protein n=1 Tax=Streptococcus agalactiae TaxID=1311 RepID=UPI002114DA31|nr:hypothetical protein [Streptococcus agalactiae]
MLLSLQLDCLRGSEETYAKADISRIYTDYTDEDLMEYIEMEFDVKPELIVQSET